MEISNKVVRKTDRILTPPVTRRSRECQARACLPEEIRWKVQRGCQESRTCRVVHKTEPNRDLPKEATTAQVDQAQRDQSADLITNLKVELSAGATPNRLEMRQPSRREARRRMTQTVTALLVQCTLQ